MAPTWAGPGLFQLSFSYAVDRHLKSPAGFDKFFDFSVYCRGYSSDIFKSSIRRADLKAEYHISSNRSRL